MCEHGYCTLQYGKGMAGNSQNNPLLGDVLNQLCSLGRKNQSVRELDCYLTGVELR